MLSGNEVEETVIATGADRQKSASVKGEEGNYVSRDFLLNYHVGPTEAIAIQSATLNGKFIIVKGKHTGSLRGAWKTSVEMKPA